MGRLTGDMLKLRRLLALLALAVAVPAHADFKKDQLEFPRVRVAQEESITGIKELFANAKIPYPPDAIFIRVFKNEMQLELWVRPKRGDAYRRLKVYDQCSTSGELGPKRHRGDLQIPEGFYRINHFNPYSTFFLSMGINYPNRSDRILKTTGKNAGGSIYIHGDCVTIGCVPITDPEIKQLYWIAVETKNAGQNTIPVHILPFRMTDDAMEAAAHRYDKSRLKFWKNIKGGYDYFEKDNRLPRVTIDKAGLYYFK